MKMKQRARKVLITIIGMLGIGLAYGYFFMTAGWGIPCFFHKITGLLCPGCGVTRMCICLMQGDIAGAAKYHGLLLFLLPFLLVIFGDYTIGYIRTGKYRLRKWEETMLYGMLAMLIVFGIFRNLTSLN